MGAPIKVPGGFMVDPENGGPPMFVPDGMGLVSEGMAADPRMGGPVGMGMDMGPPPSDMGPPPGFMGPPPGQGDYGLIMDQAPSALEEEQGDLSMLADAPPGPAAAMGDGTGTTPPYGYQDPGTGRPHPGQKTPYGITRIQGAGGNVVAGAQAQGEAQARMDDIEAQGLEGEAKLLHDQALDNKVADAAQARRMRRASNLAEIELGQVRAMKIDPDRWMNSRSTGQSVAAVILAGINGYLKPGGKNGVIDLINQQIDRDIAVQQQEIQNKQWSFGQTRNMMADLMARGQSEQQARTATGMLLWQAAKTKAMAGVAAAKSDVTRAQMQQVAAMADLEVGKLENAYEDQSYQEEIQRQDRAMAREKMRYERDAARAKAAGEAPDPNVVKDYRVPIGLDDGGTQYLDFKDDTVGRGKAEKLNTKVAAAEVVIRNTDEILKMNLDPSLPWDPERVKAAQRAAVIASKAMETVSGVPSDKDAERELAKFGGETDPKKITRWLYNKRATFEQYRIQVQEEMDSQIRQSSGGREAKWVPRAVTGRNAPKQEKPEMPPRSVDRAERFLSPHDDSTTQPFDVKHKEVMEDADHFGKLATGQPTGLGGKSDSDDVKGTDKYELAIPPAELLKEKRRKVDDEIQRIEAADEQGITIPGVDPSRLKLLKEERDKLDEWILKTYKKAEGDRNSTRGDASIGRGTR